MFDNLELLFTHIQKLNPSKGVLKCTYSTAIILPECGAQNMKELMITLSKLPNWATMRIDSALDLFSLMLYLVLFDY